MWSLKASIIFIVFTSYFAHAKAERNENKIQNIHFVLMGDVSYSMKEAYDNNELHEKSGKIYDLLEDITKKLSSRNKRSVQVSGILFGTRRGGGIADLISLTDLVNEIFNFPKIYNAKEKLIELLESYGAISLKYFMDKEGVSPNEKECNFFYNILKDDDYFCQQVVDSLPNQCKDKYYKYEKIGVKGAATLIEGTLVTTLITTNPWIGLPLAYFLSSRSNKFIDDKEDNAVIEEIIEQLKKCINHKLEKPLGEFNWDKIDYEIKPSKDVLNSIKLLKEKIPLRKNSNIMNSFSDYIYSNTPLKKAFSKSIEIIKKDPQETIKILVIISDGESTDGNPNDLKYLLKEKNIYIISFYFTSEKVEKPKQLYFRRPYGGKGLDQLYDLSSEINPYSPIFDMLEERGWDIDYTKKSKLFVKANNIEIFEEFIDIINSFVNGNNILGDMLSKIELNDYINLYNKEHRINLSQNGLPNCWCHALSKVIEYASHRIYRGKYINKYPYPSFIYLKEYLIREYGTKGKSDRAMAQILDKILPKYFLRYSYYTYIDEHKIKTILMRGRPLVLTFDLYAKQWANFDIFFAQNKKGVLTKELINKDIPYNLYKDETDGGHAVILIEYNEDGYVCLNSWGKNFGDNGKFRIKNFDVLENSHIFDVYFYESDLPKDLIMAWNEYKKENEKKFKDNYFNDEVNIN